MKICIFCKYVYGVHEKAGGMEINVRDIASCLTKKGHKVTIIASRHPDNIKNELRDKVNFFFTDTNITSNPFSRIKFFKESATMFEKINKEKKFDIIHGHSDLVYGYLKYCKKDIPVVVTNHGTTIDEFKSSIKSKLWLFPVWLILLPVYYIIEKNVLKNAKKIICVSNELKEGVIRHYNILSGKVVTIFNGVDVNKFKPFSINEKKLYQPEFLRDNDKVILSTGVIIKQKGYHLLIKSFKKIVHRYPGIKLLIAGDGPYLEELRKIVDQLALKGKVIFLGRVNNNSIQNIYNLADICVFPTLRSEGLPYVLLEAMACERSVIASRIGGIPSIVKNRENGLLIEPGNLYQLENSISELLKDKSLARRISQQARITIIKKASLDNMIKRLINLYQEVI